MVDPNTRQGKRTPVTLKIKFKSETLEQFIERYAVDVSQGGIFIRTKEPLGVGTQMKFEFQLRDASPLIGGEGTVVWTRENDPSRPAIAPGMGVRFDRLAEGSQAILERILAEKAKQAPQRPPAETTKPPMFTDVPTRVAPAPVQEQLLGVESRSQRKRPDSASELTPLPKPMPFHSDADEFPEEAFEEATKVRALDELIAQTAEQGGEAKLLSDDLAARRAAAEIATMPSHAAIPDAAMRTGQAPALAPTLVAGAVPTAASDRDSAPVLPSPPEAKRSAPKILDTTPSPRAVEGHQSGPIMSSTGAFASPSKTMIGMEPSRARARESSAPPIVSRDAVTQVSGMRAAVPEPPPTAVHAAVTPTTAAKKSSGAGAIILGILVLAAAGAAVWWFVIRPKQLAHNAEGSGSAVAIGSGSAAPVGSGSAAVPVPPPAAPLVDNVLSSKIEKATIEIVGTDQKGPSPLTAKLPKDQSFKLRVTAPGYVTHEETFTSGAAPGPIALDPKPHVVTATSVPEGALIFIDGAPTGHATPFDIELTKAQAAKKSVKVGLRKTGFRGFEKVVDAGAWSEQDDKFGATVDQKLVAAVAEVIPLHTPPPPVPVTPHPPVGSGDGSAGSAAVPTPPPPTPPEPPPTPPTNGGIPDERVPETPKDPTQPQKDPTQPQKPGTTGAPSGSAAADPGVKGAEPSPDWSK
ncbi:MAG TPA: TIGR02266 family protein [Kofleriaceae bacterium]